VSLHPRYRRLFGPVSISNDYQSMSKQLLVSFLQLHRFLPALSRFVKPRCRVKLPPVRHWNAREMSVVIRDLEDVEQLVRDLEADLRGVPVLLRQYLKLQAKFMGFNLDPDFGDVIDALLLIDLMEVDRRVLSFYMGKDETRAFAAVHSAPGG
jgi:hypothetical protein